MPPAVPSGPDFASPAGEVTALLGDERRVRSAAQELAQAIVAGANDGIVTFDEWRRFTLWNPAMELLYGVPSTEVIGRTLDECFPALARLWLKDAYDAALRGETVSLPAREITSRSTGRTAIVDATYRPLYDAHGRRIGGVGTLRDITRERETARRLARLSAIAEQTNEGVVMTDAAGCIVWVNAAWQRITGWTLDEVAGRTPGAVLRGPFSLPDARVVIREALAAGQPYSGTIVNHRRDGTPLWMIVHVTPMRDADGTLTGWVGIQHDITELRAREQQLKAERAFAASLVAANADGIVAFDRSLRVTEWNPTMEGWSGIPRSAALGLHLDDVMPLAEAEQRRARFECLLNDGQPFFSAREYTFPWSSAVWHVETAVTPIRDLDSGEITGALATIRDISERLQAEAAVRRERERLLDAIGALDSGLAMFDADERLIVFTPSFARQHPPAATVSPGMSLTELLGYVVQDGFHPMTGEPGADWIARMLARHRGVGGLFEEEVGPFMMRGAIARTRDGGSVVLLTDITEQKEIRSSLEQARDAANAASRIKSEFLARMSHELRTPLNSIIGFSQQVLRRPHAPLHDRDRLYLERVHQNGAHLLSLINSILDLSKIEAGRMDVVLAPTDVGGLVRETVALLEGNARADRVELRLELPPVLRALTTDGAQLRQVIINLVGNALKFTHAGSVVVRVEADDEQRPTRISVIDTGVGIPAERLDAIFEAFEQVDVSTARNYGGTGLGLAISRAICELLGARLDATSVVGQGSTFTIALPSAP